MRTDRIGCLLPVLLVVVAVLVVDTVGRDGATAGPRPPVGPTSSAAVGPAGSPASVVDEPGVQGSLIPLPPARLLDTRQAVGAGGARRAAGGEQVTLAVAGGAGVPQGAGGVMLNVVATDPLAPGYVTVWPCGTAPPLASNLNFGPGQTIANLVYSGLGADGTVCLMSSQATHLVVDLSGYTPASRGFEASQPQRLLDSRQPLGVPVAAKLDAGELLAVPVAPPGVSAAAILNVTVTDPDAAGYLTVWPCGSPPPTASNVNFGGGETIANLVVSAPGTGDAVCLMPSQRTHVVVDLDGLVRSGPERDAAYHGIVPSRVLDTRAPIGVPASAMLVGGQILALPVGGVGGVAQTATAVVLNLTVTEPVADGWLRAWACSSPVPPTSNVNFAAGQTIAGAAVVALGADGQICLQTNVATHVVVDVQGDIPAALAPGEWRSIRGPGPPPRWGHVMELDAKRERILVFGGVDQNVGAFNDLWSFSLTTETWEKLTTTNTPFQRWGSAGVIDVARDRLVVVDGSSTTAATNEVWALDLATLTWSPLPTGPSPRVDHAAATDGASAWFAGGDPLNRPFVDVLGDLWHLDLVSNTWEQLPPGPTPPVPRGNSGLAQIGDDLVYIGGHDQNQVFADGWLYNLPGRMWRQASLVGPLPAKAHFSYAQDDQCKALWVFGGDNDDAVDLPVLLAVTPAGNALSIAPLATPVSPPGRRHGKIIIDQARRRIYLFGGMQGNTVLADTWVVGLPACA
jgi:hypothetical protein